MTGQYISHAGYPHQGAQPQYFYTGLRRCPAIMRTDPRKPGTVMAVPSNRWGRSFHSLRKTAKISNKRSVMGVAKYYWNKLVENGTVSSLFKIHRIYKQPTCSTPGTYSHAKRRSPTTYCHLPSPASRRLGNITLMPSDDTPYKYNQRGAN